MDAFFFDVEVRDEITQKELETKRDDMYDALKKGNADLAMQKFVQVFENGCIGSCVSVDGQHLNLPRGCLGRNKPMPFTVKPPATPCCRMGRPGDIQPEDLQVGVELRRWLRQCRRLDTLEHLVKCQEKQPSVERAIQCQELWQVILKAKGFHRGFAAWVGHHLDTFVPGNCPHCIYITDLKQELLARYRKKNSAFVYSKMKIRKKTLALDIQKGGTKAFQDLKEEALPPPDHVAFEVSSKLKKVRWPKHGLTCVDCVTEHHGFNLSFPLHFQQQTIGIRAIEGARLFLTSPLKLHNGHDFKCWQIQRSSDPEQMHYHTMKAWGEFWQRDDVQSTEPWEECMPFMTSLSDCPSLDFKEFDLNEWRVVVNKSPVRSARGACAFSKRDFQLMPEALTRILFFFLQHLRKDAHGLFVGQLHAQHVLGNILIHHHHHWT